VNWREPSSIKDFRAALRFVNQLADLAEEAGHHPDIDIRYNQVRLGLVDARRRRPDKQGFRSRSPDRQADLMV
jgi:hypothetical protein